MISIVISVLIGLILCWISVPIIIHYFITSGYGQPISDYVPKGHSHKRNIPTMGGLAYLLGAFGGYFITKIIFDHKVPTASIILIFSITLVFALIGYIDDYCKIKHKRNNKGLTVKQKVILQMLTSVVYSLLSIHFPNSLGITPSSTHISFLGDISVHAFHIPHFIYLSIYIVWNFIVLFILSNGVNILDGLDGLAIGSTVMIFIGIVVIALWEFLKNCYNYHSIGCYYVRDPYDISLLAASNLGAAVAFLWYNTSPAKIFMGDVGALAIGAELAAMMSSLHVILLGIIVCGIYVMSIGSVMLQLFSIKVFSRNIFLSSPFHHHLELKGWTEPNIVVRIWIISGMFVLIGVGIFYFEWLNF